MTLSVLREIFGFVKDISAGFKTMTELTFPGFHNNLALCHDNLTKFSSKRSLNTPVTQCHSQSSSYGV